jgi:DNA-binding MarR family transcriptional regulator
METQKTPDSEKLAHAGDEIHLLREILRTHQALMAGFSQKVGMPASRYTLLRLLALTDTDIGVMELARQLGINAAAVTRQVKEMEREGLVLKQADPLDNRRHTVILSAHGSTVFEVMHERSHALERELAAVISPAELLVTMATLKKLRHFIKVQAKEDLT